ncbi:MAG: hypothetical protein JWP72_2736 [Massilia sp.]|nr:hypothetical protein [Massilia sp.]MDB5791572.1 hypothetical protein [Massilia sp.]
MQFGRGIEMKRLKDISQTITHVFDKLMELIKTLDQHRVGGVILLALVLTTVVPLTMAKVLRNHAVATAGTWDAGSQGPFI